MISTLEASKTIEKLLNYGIENELIEVWDVPQIRNQLLSLLKLEEPFEGEIDYNGDDSITKILSRLLEYAVSIDLINNTVTERDLFDSKIMSNLMPRQSELIYKFNKLKNIRGINSATDYFYKISQDSNYIRMDRVSKNKHWVSESDFGNIEITINLSKPEKDPAEIEAEKKAVTVNYPKCLLCIENVGYEGRLNHPARSNHRVIPITLDKEQWYFQYSPYVYYHEHAIIFSEEHRPMTISRNTFIRLLDFVEIFPHYFIGSNAELPIVGGSILSHDHFQGGHYELPMARAKTIKEYNNSNYPNTRIKMLKWPLSVIRLTSKNKKELIDLSDKILNLWRNYNDEAYNIYSYTEDIPHNTITPIARINKKNEFEIDLALRNNITTEDHPHGLYHPHKHLHHIKKENIGLIEVMGLAILPPRLEEEIKLIKEVLTGACKVDTALENKALIKHELWLRELISKHGISLMDSEAEEIIRAGISNKFLEAIKCSGVYKQDEDGLKGFEKFINLCSTL